MLIILLTFPIQDQYILVSMVIMGGCCLSHTVVALVANSGYGLERALVLDKVAFGMFVSVYVMFHIVMICILYCKVNIIPLVCLVLANIG